MRQLVWHNSELEALRPKRAYRPAEVLALRQKLELRGTLAMHALPTGLFPAAIPLSPGTGYDSVWVRDNAYIAYANLLNGNSQLASKAVLSILEFWWKHRHRFEAIISGDTDPNEVMERPHVRFDGTTLEELSEDWAHAQNDALGYALWVCSKLVSAGAIAPTTPLVREVSSLLIRYFAAIRFWQDEDSGHWEEARKCSASSIGTVVAGLEAFLALAHEPSSSGAAAFGESITALAADLAQRGRAALAAILPSECVQTSPDQNRRYDAALLFLVFPLRVVSPPLSSLILSDIDRYLGGEHGIRRYLGDSYWAPDYDRLLGPQDRTRNFSDDMASRDALLKRIGDEAQWCIFDAFLSAHYGEEYQKSRSPEDLIRQTHHFERALAHITPSWYCPELYYLRDGTFVANPHTPLLWAQANLSIALSAMEASVSAV